MASKKLKKQRKLKSKLSIVLAVTALITGIWLLYTVFEGERPCLDFNIKGPYLSANTTLAGVARDHKSGLSKLWIGLFKDGKEIELLGAQYPFSFLNKSEIKHQIPFKVEIDTRKLGVTDGKAILRILVRDHSWRNWFKGNQTYIEKQVTFDTKPPVLRVLSKTHNISQGGAALAVYQLSEPCKTSGIQVGEDFFPGYGGYFEDPSIHLTFFAVSYDQDVNTNIFLLAEDIAGNRSQAEFYYYIRKTAFKKDVITISDTFLDHKMPEFLKEKDFPENISAIDQFIFVNSVLRQRDNATILSNGKKSGSTLYWKGQFIRLPKSARKANFADHRVYYYHNRKSSEAIHLGIDLASLKHDAIPAANRGKVVYVEEAGIYGNLVCIDHGFGLMSLYGHLNQTYVSTGEMVDRGSIIGTTGTTGLAGGDHLHFGMFIDHVFVNPVEWWDPLWIENNITNKIKAIAAQVE